MFYLDESGFATVPNVQRAWSPLGQPHEAEAGVSRQRINVIGALDYATGKVCHDLHEGSVRREHVVDFIERLVQQVQAMPLTLIVLDNASMHHGIPQEKLDEWLVNHRVVLMHLPPYCPELNPIEIVWKQAKYHWRRFVTWSKEQLREEVLSLMEGIGTTHKISFA